jgi:HEAT repeat protein
MRRGWMSWAALLGLAVGGIFLTRVIFHDRGRFRIGAGPASRGAATGSGAAGRALLRLPPPPHGGAAKNAPFPSLDNTSRSSLPRTTENWRTSPRLWSFSREDADRVSAMLAAFATAIREGKWDALKKLSEEFKKLGERAVGPLLDVLLRDPDDHLRVYAASLLGELQDQVPGGLLDQALRAYATPMLEELAAASEEPSLRHSALVAMAKIGDPGALDFLVDTLRRAQGWPFVGDAVQALGALRDPSVTSSLADLAQSEPDPNLRERFARALGARADPAAWSDLEDLAARDPDPGVRQAAVMGLGKLGTPEADQTLEDIVKDDANASVRSAAVEALGRPGDDGPLDFLTDLLASPGDPQVRTTAYYAIEKVGTSDARSAIASYRPAARIESVIPGSQAQALGLSPNDVITMYDGKPVKRASDLPVLVRSTPPTRLVPLVVEDPNGGEWTYSVRGGFLGITISNGVVLD